MKRTYKSSLKHWLDKNFRLMLPVTTKDEDVPGIVASAKDNCSNAFSLGLMCKERDLRMKYRWRKISARKFPKDEHILLYYPLRKGDNIYLGRWPKYDATFDGSYYIRVCDLFNLSKI